MTERYAIKLTKSAEKQLYDLPPKQFKQVAKKIFSLQSEPRPQDYKPLQGHPGSYRVAQGEYRILYPKGFASCSTWGGPKTALAHKILESEVEIFRVGKRNDDEVYRNL